MKKTTKCVLAVVKGIAIAMLSFVLAGAISFGVLIVGGLSPTLQSIWICSAMRTFHHKYLATWFFSEEKIAEVLAANEIDDSGMNSDILDFSHLQNRETTSDSASEPTESQPAQTEPAETTPPEPDPTDYVGQGYEELEEGVYLKEVSGIGWRGFLMLVADPFRVKLVDTAMQYECGQNVMTMVKQNDCVGGINAGGFVDGPNYDSNGGIPAGLLMEDGRLVNPQEPDGTTVYSMVGINDKGALVLQHCTDMWAMENGIVSAVTASPYLIVNGEGTIKKGSGGWGLAPRTAIGQRKTGEIILMVVDGRQVDWSLGCDLDVLQDTLLAEGCVNAAMMDGGSSTAMVYNGEYINRPSLGHERWINNAWVVMKKQ